MAEGYWMEFMQKQGWLEEIRKMNQYTEKFGLTLSQEDTEVLLAERAEVLKSEQRVEFGGSILPQLIYAFCDSAFISQDNYLDTIVRLQEIFFLYKNEMRDEITDEELVNFMREQFNGVCYGDLDYLEGTCLEIFAEAVRAGYRGYQGTRGSGEFAEMDIVQRWDRELYMEVLNQLF